VYVRRYFGLPPLAGRTADPHLPEGCTRGAVFSRAKPMIALGPDGVRHPGLNRDPLKKNYINVTSRKKARHKPCSETIIEL
jgi:hypothetical protein